MVAATVLIPTHDHQDTLAFAVASAQAQTIADIEIVIVGDGAPARTAAIVRELQAGDARVRFFDNPKGERHGELHRHAALAEARGRIVCYLADDDLWLPDHVAALDALLRDCDFGHTMLTAIEPDGAVRVRPWDVAEPSMRARMLADDRYNGISLSVAGHTLAAYRRLPHGWRPAPPGIWSDFHMWRQFLAEPWCGARSAMQATALSFPAPMRRDWSLARRVEELRAWAARAARPDFAAWLAQTIVPVLAGECVAWRLAYEFRSDAAPGS